MKALLQIIVLIFSFNLYAQEKEFTVFYFKGNVEIIKADVSSKPVPLRQPRTKLFGGEKLRLYPSSAVILYHNGGSSFELNKPAIYSMDSLFLIVSDRKKTGALSKYISFLSNEYKKEHENLEDYKKRHQRDKGGVTRGSCSIHLLSPVIAESTVDSTLTFSWRSDKTKEFDFGIYTKEEAGHTLVKRKTTDTVYQLQINSTPIERGKIYYWAVAPSGETECMRYPFKILNETDRLTVKNEIDEIEKVIGLGQNLKSIFKAACYEGNSLYRLAKEQYLAAIKAAPGETEFKKLYNEFLARVGLVNESLSLLGNVEN